MVYGCDGAWWKYRKGLPEFNGLKLRWSGNGADFPDVRPVEIATNPKGGPRKYVDSIILEPVGTIGSGGNSGFQALNLAVQFGAKRIILIGFDMTDQSGVHWYGRNHWHMANNPDETNFRRWIAAFEKAAPMLRNMGVEVVNVSMNSALTCFPKMRLEDAL